jgi:general secretion pathway protein A
MQKPMALPIMSAEKPSLSIALKTLWGAAEMPFGDACAEAYRHPHFEYLTHRLQQLCEIGASGLLHGPNGVGKSYLCGCLTEKLPEKRYKILWLAHSSLTGSDLIRSLCRQLGIEAQMRRSDNVAEIHAAFAQLGSRWPLLVLEEAQNLSASALEEVRLLTCARSDTRPPFSLLLVGDDSLLPRLQMGINRALLSRLGFALALARLEPAQSRDYVAARLSAVGVHANPFEDQALELLIQAAGGLPRAINHLAQRAIEAAALSGNSSISTAHLQAALDRLPWFSSLAA